MKTAARLSLVALLLAGFAAPASAAPATTSGNHDDSVTSFGKVYMDWCILPATPQCRYSNSRWLRV
ncbi:hypothetical protein BKH03_09955 [Actinomyces naeslundii]|nr:hypothetical protein BKH03_09955 [Actinomyces naeslundii]OMG41655.1 hypothetical protein BKH14_00280 [Actinomyces naeslundii]